MRIGVCVVVRKPCIISKPCSSTILVRTTFGNVGGHIASQRTSNFIVVVVVRRQNTGTTQLKHSSNSNGVRTSKTTRNLPIEHQRNADGDEQNGARESDWRRAFALHINVNYRHRYSIEEKTHLALFLPTIFLPLSSVAIVVDVLVVPRRGQRKLRAKKMT